MLDPLRELSRYDVVFEGAGVDDRSAIPLGNGEVGVKAWVQRDVGIVLEIGRTDALSEFDRTVKLGRVRLHTVPDIFAGATVRQRLDLAAGALRIDVAPPADRAPVSFVIAVDKTRDRLLIELGSDDPVGLRLEPVVWRTSPRLIQQRSPFWGGYDPISELAGAAESADHQANFGDRVAVWHHNEFSVVPALAKLHGLDDRMDLIPDELVGREFGMILGGVGAETSGNAVVVSAATRVRAWVDTFSSQEHSAEESVIGSEILDPATFDSALAETAVYWRDYWQRSWIFVTGDPSGIHAEVAPHAAAKVDPSSLPVVPFDASSVTRGYVLTKWMVATGVGGAFPLYFSGGLYNPMPGDGIHVELGNFVDDQIADFTLSYFSPTGAEPDLNFNPDERAWTLEHLWQNLRLPYYSLLSRGESEPLRAVFRYFRRFFALNRLRAERYFSAAGQFSTEMTLSCGLMTPAIYGVDRTALAPGIAANKQGGSLQISPGLELATLMFDYSRFVGGDAGVLGDAIELSLDLLRYVDSRYRADEATIVIAPLNSVETYFDTTDPLPVIAGLHRVLRELDQHASALGEGDREFVSWFRAALPAIPVRDAESGRVLAPARSYEAERMNCEVPEFYAIFPFNVADHTDADLDASWHEICAVAGGFVPRILGENLYNGCFSGWQYYGPTAARLGRAAEAATVISHNSALNNPAFAFPAMWGPIYDSVPDGDHGGNLLSTLQEMVLPAGDTERLLAAWPAEWTVDYKLYDRNGAIVTGRYSPN